MAGVTNPFGRVAILAVGVLAAGELAPATAAAQTCFRGRPEPTCASFFLTEAEGGLVVPLDGGGTGARVGVDVGFIRNVGSRSAIGATIAGGAYLNGGESGFVSLRPRYRHWLSPTTSLDVGPGVQWTPGRIERIEARAAFTYRDLFGVWTEVDFDWGQGSTAWLVGAKTGAQAGVVSYIAGAITLGILAIVYAGSAD
ncbi:MAG: hypothetical protein AMJ58_10290 [Gammaproteobacteria bacterium SG8_30]|jgi:hypothetical protein|nr:MAG: hypothetical protein AMJ58_10290 [Gammaproteobacteria bacterium SG8_30]